jgi:hypothetical protein
MKKIIAKREEQQKAPTSEVGDECEPMLAPQFINYEAPFRTIITLNYLLSTFPRTHNFVPSPTLIESQTLLQ